jgi:transcriptional regulator with XRE-family HTH domain
MATSVFTPSYQSFLATLVALRREHGVSQVELARRLGKPQQFVSRVELGVRRLDLVEFCAIADALGVDPRQAFARVVDAFPVGRPK